MTISKDQPRNKKGTPETTNNHRFRQHNVIQKTVREKNKTPGNK